MSQHNIEKNSARKDPHQSFTANSIDDKLKTRASQSTTSQSVLRGQQGKSYHSTRNSSDILLRPNQKYQLEDLPSNKFASYQRIPLASSVYPEPDHVSSRILNKQSCESLAKPLEKRTITRASSSPNILSVNQNKFGHRRAVNHSTGSNRYGHDMWKVVGGVGIKREKSRWLVNDAVGVAHSTEFTPRVGLGEERSRLSSSTATYEPRDRNILVDEFDMSHSLRPNRRHFGQESRGVADAVAQTTLRRNPVVESGTQTWNPSTGTQTPAEVDVDADIDFQPPRSYAGAGRDLRDTSEVSTEHRREFVWPRQERVIYSRDEFSRGRTRPNHSLKRGSSANQLDLSMVPHVGDPPSVGGISSISDDGVQNRKPIVRPAAPVRAWQMGREDMASDVTVGVSGSSRGSVQGDFAGRVGANNQYRRRTIISDGIKHDFRSPDFGYKHEPKTQWRGKCKIFAICQEKITRSYLCDYSDFSESRRPQSAPQYRRNYSVSE